MALVAERVFPSVSAGWLNVLALFAIVNTALFNLIMGSRILYGMGCYGFIPRFFSYVHPRRQTPTWGIGMMGILVFAVALTGFLRVLAEATSVLILTAFLTVNASLLIVRYRRLPPDDPTVKYFRAPIVVPIAGLGVTAYMLFQFSSGAYFRAVVLVACGVILYTVQKRWLLDRRADGRRPSGS